MSTVSKLFDFARLADAAYVNFGPVDWSVSDNVADAAAVDRLPRSLADATFDLTPTGWQVAHYYDAENDINGFAATLFKNSAGRYVLAGGVKRGVKGG